MFFKLQIDDSLFEHYVKRYGLPKAYQVMKRHLIAMKDVDENDRYLILAGDERREIEAIFQTTMDTASKLAKSIKRLNAVKISEVAVDFTTDELERIDSQARFHAKSREQFIFDMAQEIKGYMLERV